MEPQLDLSLFMAKTPLTSGLPGSAWELKAWPGTHMS